MVLFVFQLFCGELGVFGAAMEFQGTYEQDKYLVPGPDRKTVQCTDEAFSTGSGFLGGKHSQLISFSLPITFESSIVSLYQQPGGRRKTVNLALTLDLILLQNESCACLFPTAICSVYPRDWSEINFYQLSVSSRCVVRAQTCTSVLPICSPGLLSGIETEACVHILKKRVYAGSGLDCLRLHELLFIAI